MSSYLEKLREKSKQSVDELSKQIDNTEKKSYGDDRFWKLTVDKAGNGEAVIRFLPPIEGESSPWIEKWNHSFQGPSGKWFIENCPTTIKGECPVCDANRAIWDTNPKEVAQKKTEKTKRVHKFYSNILVVDDPTNKENNGKVFLFEYGPRIFSKIKEAIKPLSSRHTPIDPFSVDVGANFVLLAKSVSGQRNYDSSSFEAPSPISNDDETIEKIVNSLYSLNSITTENNFKKYEDLKRYFDKVMGRTVVSREVEEETEEGYEIPENNEDFKGSLKNLDLDDLPF